MTEEVVRAAGGVVWRRQDGGDIEVLLVHRPKYDDWSLPKGKADQGESDEACALREVREETGLCCELGPYLGEFSYIDKQDRPKVARFWAMRPVAGEFRPSDEVDEVAWLSVPDARARLTRGQDAEMVDLLDQHIPYRVRILLVRHATAGERDAWKGDDRLRPLDDRGRRQAQGLVRQLSSYPIERVLSSPHLRCVQSVQPLAEARGLVVEETERLAEENPEDALALISQLEGSTAVICTHGDVIPVVLDAMLAGDHHEPSEKGSTWAIDAGQPGPTSATYLEPPS